MHAQSKSLEPFTWTTYAHYLDVALAAGFKFIGFDEITESAALPDYKFILLRHDIDFNPDWVLPMSEIEAGKNISATYFFQMDSPFYRFDDPHTASVVREVLRQGHSLGLHFDANKIEDEARLLKELESAALAVERQFETSIKAVSFHMPSMAVVRHLKLPNGRVNTYAPLFFDRIEYISDSNQNWRDKDLPAILDEGKVTSIQLLIHPMWWREKFVPFYDKMAELAAKLGWPVADVLTDDQRSLYNLSD